MTTDDNTADEIKAQEKQVRDSTQYLHYVQCLCHQAGKQVTCIACCLSHLLDDTVL